MYAVIGLSIGYFAYRKGGGNLISAAFRPLLGDRVDRAPGKAIDVVAIFATLFGKGGSPVALSESSEQNSSRGLNPHAG